MKQALILIAAALTGWSTAHAQDVDAIARVLAGETACRDCNLFQADFSYRQLKKRDLAGARLRQADLSLSIMNRTSFEGADLRDVNAFGAVMSSANLRGADLAHATFVGTWLEGADLTDANLEGVNFSGARLIGTKGLTQDQLNAACGDGATKAPEGLALPSC